MIARQKSWMEGPWPWLAYLPFYATPWLWRTPDAGQLIAFGIGLAVFLPAYVIGYRQQGVRLIGAAAIVLAVGIGLSTSGGNWTVLCVYAAAMAGLLRPPRVAAAVIVAAIAITLGAALALKLSPIWWTPGVLLMATTGAATASREAFHARNQRLLATQEQVRRLAGTAERERIARDLHDVIGRTLTLVALKADLAVRLTPRNPVAAEGEMRAIAEAARSGLSEVREALAGQLRGSLAHETGASVTALTAAQIATDLTGEPADIPRDAGAVLAMTLREAVTNVIRHAGATHCTIAVSCDRGMAQLTVADDGQAGDIDEGNGLTGMRQRLAAAGGSLVIKGSSSGLTLIARVPA